MIAPQLSLRLGGSLMGQINQLPRVCPLPQDHVQKQIRSGSQEVEKGPDNRTSPAKAKEQETCDGTDRLPLGTGGSMPPGHVQKPNSETEDAYIPGNKSTRRRKRDKQKDAKVIFQAGGGKRAKMAQREISHALIDHVR